MQKTKIIMLSSIVALILIACVTDPKRMPVGPAAYRIGYAAGCDSGYDAAGHFYYKFNKDPARYARDRMYAQGWNDGFRVCKGKYDAID